MESLGAFFKSGKLTAMYGGWREPVVSAEKGQDTGLAAAEVSVVELDTKEGEGELSGS